MSQVQIKKLHPDAQVPKYSRPGDAGLDLHAYTDVVIAPSTRALIPTGIAFSIPEGTVGLIWDRSGLAAKQGLTTMSGVLDHTYRGEIVVVLFNTTAEPYEVKKGDRVAQLLIQPIVTAQVTEVAELSESVRGENKFGSSGR